MARRRIDDVQPRDERTRSHSKRLIHDPVVILAAPRSGSSILFALLSAHPDLWSLYRESNVLFEGPFDPISTGRASNRLTADDLDEPTRAHLVSSFYRAAGNLERVPLLRRLPLRGRGRASYAHAISLVSTPLKRPPIRLVEKSPKNSLRVPFMRSLFPDARFLHLIRDPRSNVASLYRAWQTPDRYKTYPLPPGFVIHDYDGDHWSFMLPPGWEALDGHDLIHICAEQWRSCNAWCLDDLDEIDGDRVCRVRYEELIRSPEATLERIARWADLVPDPLRRFTGQLPVVQATTRPDPRKWESLRDKVEHVLPVVDDVAQRLGYG